MKNVTAGSELDIEYEGRLEDGSLFDTNKIDVAKAGNAFSEKRKYEPLHVKLGQGMLIRGFENALIGMEEGEEKEVNIPPEEGYGMRKDDLVRDVEEAFFQGKAVKKEDIILVNVQGQNFPAVVAQAGPEFKLDFNHPLAGKTLIFKMKVLKVYE